MLPVSLQLAVVTCLALLTHALQVNGLDQQMQVGHEAVLVCETTDMQTKLEFKWYHNGAEILESDQYHISQANNSLTIVSTVHEDAGEYICNSTLNNGQIVKSTVNLNAAPYVATMGTSKNLVQGDPLILHCNAWGHPPPSVTWMINKAEGYPEDGQTAIDEVYIEEDRKEVGKAEPRIHISNYSDAGPVILDGTLRIDGLDYSDRAQYTCIATDVAGASSNTTIIVRVKDKLAALWPFLGICAEVLILCIIIFFYEHHRAKKMADEEPTEETGHLTNSADHKGKDEVRHRK